MIRWTFGFICPQCRAVLWVYIGNINEKGQKTYHRLGVDSVSGLCSSCGYGTGEDKSHVWGEHSKLKWVPYDTFLVRWLGEGFSYYWNQGRWVPQEEVEAEKWARKKLELVIPEKDT